MKKFIAGISLAVATLLAADYQFGLGVGRHNVSKSPIDTYNFLNLRLGKYLPNNNVLRGEFEFAVPDVEIKNFDSGTSLLRGIVNLEHDFILENSKLVPYIFGGAGVQGVGGNYPDSLIADIGLGAKYEVKNNLGLFLEGRALRAFHNNDNHYGVLGGLVYSFGGEKAAPVATKPADSDGDGVVDSQDKCPNTPAGVKVDTQGCPLDTDGDGVADYLDKCPNTPAGVSVDAKGCPVDSDNDGVADYLDKCPNTPAGVSVDANGCPVDSDNDGVADYLDKCPNTPAGFKVDKNGCAISYNFMINFDTNSAEIKPEYMERIRKFAEFLKNHPNVKAEIQGYTDNRGSYSYNVKLSQRRAKAVYDALIKLGVPKDQIKWAGYGPNNPIASNDTPEGRAKNRRVVAIIIY